MTEDGFLKINIGIFQTAILSLPEDKISNPTFFPE